MSVEIPSLLTMLESGMHFGHRVSRWHPKMKQYIFTARTGVHIIDLKQTAEKLKSAMDFLESSASKGEKVLLVGVKRQLKDTLKEKAESFGISYVSEKWVGGTVTNWTVIFRQIKKMQKMREEKEKGEWNKFTKKEQLILQEDLDRLNHQFGGLRALEKVPRAVFFFDMKESKNAVSECRGKGIATVALCDTNTNPDLVDYPIPANDDAIKSLNLVLALVCSAITRGKMSYEKAKEIK